MCACVQVCMYVCIYSLYYYLSSTLKVDIWKFRTSPNAPAFKRIDLMYLRNFSKHTYWYNSKVGPLYRLLNTPSGNQDHNSVDEKWTADEGIKFSLATMDDVEELKEFLHLHYYPYEPVARSIGIMRGNNLFDKYTRYIYDKDMVDAIKQNDDHVRCSVIARNIASNRIVGGTYGTVNSIYDSLEYPVFGWLRKIPLFVPLPGKFSKLVNWGIVLDDLNYSKRTAFKELKDSGNLIHFARRIAVRKEASRNLLGLELYRRSMRIATLAGCRYSYALATNLYSQNMLRNFGKCKVLEEVNYEDYQFDAGKHKKVQVLAVDIQSTFGTDNIS